MEIKDLPISEQTPMWNLPLEVRMNKLGAAIFDKAGYHICNIYRPCAQAEAQAFVDAINKQEPK